MSTSATLFDQFPANLNQHPRLSRDMVFKVAQETFDDMQSDSALLAQFQANLNQYPALNRDTVFQVAKQTFDHFFAQTQPMMVSGVVTGGVAGAKAVPIQWSRILNSKEFGLPTFFKAEHNALKAATPGLNYFTAVSQLRTMFEGTDRWTEYVEFVRNSHPSGAGLKDPSPRQTKTGTTPMLQAVPQPPTLPTAATLQTAPTIPTAIPHVVQSVHMSVPVELAQGQAIGEVTVDSLPTPADF